MTIAVDLSKHFILSPFQNYLGVINRKTSSLADIFKMHFSNMKKKPAWMLTSNLIEMISVGIHSKAPLSKYLTKVWNDSQVKLRQNTTNAKGS